MPLTLWNFRTSKYDDNVNLSDANVKDYYPPNVVLDNLYATRRDLGDNARTAFQHVLESVTWPQMG